MKKLLVVLAGLIIVGVFIWQGFTAHGSPDPTAKGLSPIAMIMSSAVLVFREGLEAILVLAAVTAGLARTNRTDYLRAVPLGALVAFLASVATWFLLIAIISKIHVPALDLQAATGLVAIIVLMVIMNWFFHKVYWTGGNLKRCVNVKLRCRLPGEETQNRWGGNPSQESTPYERGYPIRQ